MGRRQKFNIVSQQKHEKENGILSNSEGKVLCHWKTNYCRILLFTGIVLYFTTRRQQKLKRCPAMSRILPFSSPQPSVANSIQPQSYLQHYSTSVWSKEERQTDTTGMGPEWEWYTLLLKFLSASGHNIIVYFFQYMPRGKTAKTVSDREDQGDADHFK